MPLNTNATGAGGQPVPELVQQGEPRARCEAARRRLCADRSVPPVVGEGRRGRHGALRGVEEEGGQADNREAEKNEALRVPDSGFPYFSFWRLPCSDLGSF